MDLAVMSKREVTGTLRLIQLNVETAFRSASLFRLDPELLDERPPFLGIGFHKRAERLRCLWLARENVRSEIDQPRSHYGIGQCLHGRRVEFSDNLLWCAAGREKRVGFLRRDF